MLLDGRKFVCYGQEDASGLRLQIDSRTLVFENEHDPSQLRTPTPGKLARQLVENGEHVASGAAYAELEVMKMFLPLVAHARFGAPRRRRRQRLVTGARRRRTAGGFSLRARPAPRSTPAASCVASCV